MERRRLRRACRRRRGRAHHEGGRCTDWDVVHVDADVRPPRRSHADGRLRADARGSNGGIHEELAAGVGAMTNHDEEPAPLPALVWAVVFTILLVAAVAIFTLVLIR
jgi:hypothetical protein